MYSETLFRQVHESCEAHQLYQIANPNRYNKKDPQDTVGVVVRSLAGNDDGVARFIKSDTDALKGIRDRNFYTYLQYRLENYACWFFSIPGYTRQKASVPEEVDKNIMKKIESDLFAASEREDSQKLALVLYSIAREMADKYYELLSEYRYESVQRTDLELRILPRKPEATLTLTIISNKADADLPACIHIHGHITDVNSGPKQIKICSEDDLDERLRANCGLSC